MQTQQNYIGKVCAANNSELSKLFVFFALHFSFLLHYFSAKTDLFFYLQTFVYSQEYES